jgi:hypothetical protein
LAGGAHGRRQHCDPLPKLVSDVDDVLARRPERIAGYDAVLIDDDSGPVNVHL